VHIGPFAPAPVLRPDEVRRFLIVGNSQFSWRAFSGSSIRFHPPELPSGLAISLSRQCSINWDAIMSDPTTTISRGVTASEGLTDKAPMKPGSGRG
jgi:hypothetical protein